MRVLLQTAAKRLRQGGRFARLFANLNAGGAFIQSCYTFPQLSHIKSNQLNDYAPFRLWVKDLVKSMNVELSIEGDLIEPGGMFVANHISWLDTIVLNHAAPMNFIARHDLIDWPFIGTFTQRMDSVFIDRSNKFQAYRSLPNIEERLSVGRSVLVFPESTTSNGRGLLPFYPMFFEAAVRCGAWVQPVRLTYRDAQGLILEDAAFIGDDSFLDTLSRVLYTDKVYANLKFLEPLKANALGRKRTCAEAERLIAQAM